MNCTELNYGLLSTVSQNVNCKLFNDCSGLTISRRATQGFMQLTRIPLCPQYVEHIIHGAMFTTFWAFRKDKSALGLTLLLALIASYQLGKN